MQATKLNPLARIPAQATMGAAGYDLTSVQAGVIYPSQRRMVATGISLAVPDGMVGIIKPRSGLAVNHGIDVLAGVVDSDFRGELQVVLINHGERPFEYAPGDRIAQIVLLPCYHGVCEEVESLDETMRAVGGFGSTGR